MIHVSVMINLGWLVALVGAGGLVAVAVDLARRRRPLRRVVGTLLCAVGVALSALPGYWGLGPEAVGVLLLIAPPDDWWRRGRRKLAAAALKARRYLAWGVPAKRPVPA